MYSGKTEPLRDAGPGEQRWDKIVLVSMLSECSLVNGERVECLRYACKNVNLQITFWTLEEIRPFLSVTNSANKFAAPFCLSPTHFAIVHFVTLEK